MAWPPGRAVACSGLRVVAPGRARSGTRRTASVDSLAAVGRSRRMERAHAPIAGPERMTPPARAAQNAVGTVGSERRPYPVTRSFGFDPKHRFGETTPGLKPTCDGTRAPDGNPIRRSDLNAPATPDRLSIQLLVERSDTLFRAERADRRKVRRRPFAGPFRSLSLTEQEIVGSVAVSALADQKLVFADNDELSPRHPGRGIRGRPSRRRNGGRTSGSDRRRPSSDISDRFH